MNYSLCNCISCINATGKELSKYSRLNPEQNSLLEEAFDSNSYLDHDRLMHLSKQTHLDEIRIRRWFRNRRTHIRKGRKKGTASQSEYYLLQLHMYMYLFINNKCMIPSFCLPACLACPKYLPNAHAVFWFLWLFLHKAVPLLACLYAYLHSYITLYILYIMTCRYIHIV